MQHIFIAFFIAAVITYLAIPVILNIAHEKKLYDIPDDRKIHKKPIPSLGGVAIFAGFLIALLLAWPTQITVSNSLLTLQFITAASLVIFFLGLKDDIVVISPLKKFIGQLLAAWIIVYKCKLQITSFYGVFGIYEIPNVLSLMVTYLAVVLIINSFNLIDGVDGLSGHLTLIASVSFAIYFYSYRLYTVDNIGYAVMAASMAGAIASFLVFNHHPAKIFMGDTGSLLIGLISAVMLIKFINVTGTYNETLVNPEGFYIKGGPVLALAILFVPLFDTVRVFGLRIINGRSPFSPDRKHIHHILLDKGFTHNRITMILSFASILLILSTFFINLYFNATISLIILIFLSCILFTVAVYYPKKKQNQLVVEKSEDTNSKIVNMARDAVL